MGKVVRLDRSETRPIAPGPLFEAAWRAFPDTGRMRSSRRLAAFEWASAALEVGEQALLAAVLRYVRDDKDYRKECGAPGFHRWLAMGRWDYWVETEVALSKPKPVTVFPEAALRASFHRNFRSSKARAWLDRCGWDVRTKQIVNPGLPLRAEWLNGPLAKWALENGVQGLVVR